MIVLSPFRYKMLHLWATIQPQSPLFPTTNLIPLPVRLVLSCQREVYLSSLRFFFQNAKITFSLLFLMDSHLRIIFCTFSMHASYLIHFLQENICNQVKIITIKLLKCWKTYVKPYFRDSFSLGGDTNKCTIGSILLEVYEKFIVFSSRVCLEYYMKLY